MELPLVLEFEGGYSPVALQVVALEFVLHELGAGSPRDLHRAIGAEGIDDMNVVRDPVRAGQGLGQGGLGIEGQDDDGNGHRCLPLASSDRAPAKTSAYILSNSTATLDQSQRARTLALAASAILAWASASSSRRAAAA